MTRRLALATAFAAIAAGLASPGAGAAGQAVPWNGVNPFRCTLQHAGTGTKVPNPGADPYCVDFDKRHQNVTQLGVVDFLSKEPARVAAAGPKCFYFQSDHWRGSIVQSNGATKTYQWDGHYFYDKAKGDGGAWVTNFNVNGHTANPAQMPGMPSSWARYMGPGTGGVRIENDIPVDPACAARAQHNPAAIYARGGHPGHGHPSHGPRCVATRGAVRRARLGAVRLGERDGRVRRRLGAPRDVRNGFLVYCVHGGGSYLVGQPWSGVGAVRDEASAPTVIVLTTARGYAFGDVRAGAPARRATRGAREVVRVDGYRVWSLRRGVLAGTRDGRVRFIAVYSGRSVRTRRALARLIGRALA